MLLPRTSLMKCPTAVRPPLEEQRHPFDNGANVPGKFPNRRVDFNTRDFQERRVIHFAFSVGISLAFGY